MKTHIGTFTANAARDNTGLSNRRERFCLRACKAVLRICTARSRRLRFLHTITNWMSVMNESVMRMTTLHWAGMDMLKKAACEHAVFELKQTVERTTATVTGIANMRANTAKTISRV
jgi:Asp/Glu/hydantoin racemase